MKEYLIIGLDGGASKINGWTIHRDSVDESFNTGDKNCSKKYSEYPEFNPNFKPVDLGTQLSEMNTRIKLRKEEIKQGFAYKKALLDVLLELIEEHSKKNIIIGIGMPGLKSKDKRGICALANGPRIPDLSDFIESELSYRNIKLAHPIHRLGSDADYCGIGEEYAVQGSFRNFQNVYYLGGGTGVADAIKLRGQLYPFDHINEWIAKTWEMSTEGLSLERFVSARGIQYIYSLHSEETLPELDKRGIFGTQILNLAMAGDKNAAKTMNSISDYIAKLLFERISTVYTGWSGLFEFVNSQKKQPESDHEFRGIKLEKLVIGQRLGELFHDSKQTDFLYDPLLRKLGELIWESGSVELQSFYLKEGLFDPSKILFSKLRAAPAIGAGVDAWFASQNLKI